MRYDYIQGHGPMSDEILDFTYLRQPPKRYTFEQPKLKLWVEAWCNGKVLNLFSGRTKLNVDEVRVDIDLQMPCDFLMDAMSFVEFATTTEMLFGTIILDPPYNIRKSREKYEGRFIGSLTRIKNALMPLLPLGGRIISLGYDTVGMSRSRGFKKLAICVVCHGGDHNDTLCVVEERCT